MQLVRTFYTYNHKNFYQYILITIIIIFIFLISNCLILKSNIRNFEIKFFRKHYYLECEKTDVTAEQIIKLVSPKFFVS